MIKHLKQHGCRTACQAANRNACALKKQLGALGVRDRAAAGWEQGRYPTCSDMTTLLTMWDEVRKIGV
jgi:hypothetical protein